MCCKIRCYGKSQKILQNFLETKQGLKSMRISRQKREQQCVLVGQGSAVLGRLRPCLVRENFWLWLI